jgi:hypothetical protein
MSNIPNEAEEEEERSCTFQENLSQNLSQNRGGGDELMSS